MAKTQRRRRRGGKKAQRRPVRRYPGAALHLPREEAYLRDFYLGQMKKKLLSAGMEAFNLHTFQAKECDPKALGRSSTACP